MLVFFYSLRISILFQHKLRDVLHLYIMLYALTVFLPEENAFNPLAYCRVNGCFETVLFQL